MITSRVLQKAPFPLFHFAYDFLGRYANSLPFQVLCDAFDSGHRPVDGREGAGRASARSLHHCPLRTRSAAVTFTCGPLATCARSKRRLLREYARSLAQQKREQQLHHEIQSERIEQLCPQVMKMR